MTAHELARLLLAGPDIPCVTRDAEANDLIAIRTVDIESGVIHWDVDGTQRRDALVIVLD